MRFAIASAAIIGAASASYGYGYPPAVNSTTSVAPPSYETTPPAYESSTPPAYETSTPPTYETTVVTELTTVCPTPTEVTYGGKTYTVTESTTLTITDCPCTVSYPVVPTSAPGYSSAPPAYTPPAVPYPSGNASVPYVPGPTGTAPSGTAAPPEFTGAATKMGAGIMAIAAAAAAFL